jgi:predicted protein tyrosine phosphatase
MGTYILNKYKATTFEINPELYNVMIRITNPGEDFLPLKNELIYRDILEIRFYDFLHEQNGLMVFNESIAETLLEYFDEHKHCKNMIIHCDYGISRSAGVAVGWLMFNDDRASIHKIYHDKKHMPNRLVVETFAKNYPGQ